MQKITPYLVNSTSKPTKRRIFIQSLSKTSVSGLSLVMARQASNVHDKQEGSVIKIEFERDEQLATH